MIVAAEAMASSFWDTVNWMDAAVVFVAVVAALLGFWSGFLWQVVRVTSWLAAFWVAGRFHYHLARLAGEMFSEQARLILSYAVLLMVTVLVLYLLSHLARSAVNAFHVETGDRLLGAVVGLAKGLFICGVLGLMIMTYVPEGASLRRHVSSSPLASNCSRAARLLWLIMPGRSPFAEAPTP